MKGIVLAAGNATRLYPTTKIISKHLLPIYDKPMIYYSLSTLMLAGIREIMIITTSRDMKKYKELLGNGNHLGLHLSYAIQDKANGIAEAFIIAEDFIGEDNVSLILGDNFFYGEGFSEKLKTAAKLKEGGLIFGYYVQNPSDFGIVSFDDDFNILSIEEKPKKPKSNYAVPGLYFYDNDVIEIAKKIEPSSRNELEITSINNAYLQKKSIELIILGRGTTWLDMGTQDGLLEAANFVGIIQKRQGLYISCLEEIAYRNNWIKTEDLIDLSAKLTKIPYGEYLLQVVNEIKSKGFGK